MGVTTDCRSSSCGVQSTPPTFKLHTFATEAANKSVLFQVIKMSDSCIIFINYKDNMTLDDLSLSMFNNKRMDSPIATQILGNFVEETSKMIALKLSKRLGKTVYVSYNIDFDRITLPLIEARLFKEIKEHPDRF